LGDHVRSQTDVAMKNEALGKCLGHHIVVVHQSQRALGLEPVFWGRQTAADTEPPAALPMVRRPG
jgi:hypothetical protein